MLLGTVADLHCIMSMVLTIVLIWLGVATLGAIAFSRLKAAQKHYGKWTRDRLSELPTQTAETLGLLD